MFSRLFGVGTALLVLLVPPTVVTQNANAVTRVDFARDVQPIFQQHCIGAMGVSPAGRNLGQRGGAHSAAAVQALLKAQRV